MTTYTIDQAIKDGSVIDLNQYIPINESRFKWPMVCTSGVFGVIEKAVANKKHCNDYKGIIWDIITMIKYYMNKGENKNSSLVILTVIITGAARNKYWTMYAAININSSGQPIITIILPEEY